MNCKYVILLLILGFPVTATIAQELSSDEDTRALQRQVYSNAKSALEKNELVEFQQLLEQLSDYPLLPYLEYARLGQQLVTLSTSGTVEPILEFLSRNEDSVLANRLERQWLAALVDADRQADLLRYYNPANATTELTCHWLKARLDSGDTNALDNVAPLWNVTYSQPNVCDPVFDAWLQGGGMNPELGWQRFSANLKAGNTNLANYIAKLLPAPEQTLAQTFLAVHGDPKRLSQLESFSADNPQTREIILHGLQRLSASDAPASLALLNAYEPLQDFQPPAHLATERYIIQRMLFQGHIAAAEELLHSRPSLRSETLVEWLLRNSLGQQDWVSFDNRLQLLPQSAAESERWQYWHARSLLQKELPATNTDANALLSALAGNRSFYGFLAADLLKQPYALVDRPVQVSPLELLQLTHIPAIERARELYLLDDEPNALREWDHALASMDEAQIVAAGKLAADWGWHRNGIQAMIKVSYWDDLQLRFPLVYQDYVANAINSNPLLNVYFVNAIARQESAFITDIVSSAGARGLMQLMPATARETASEIRIRIDNEDLFDPEINITLGSRYLAKMMQEFDHSRILAAAAYNAGPTRVRGWINQVSTNIPIDIWIETLPFGETRGYVQNVLAYAVIYAYRHGESIPMISETDKPGFSL